MLGVADTVDERDADRLPVPVTVTTSVDEVVEEGVREVELLGERVTGGVVLPAAELVELLLADALPDSVGLTAGVRVSVTSGVTERVELADSEMVRDTGADRLIVWLTVALGEELATMVSVGVSSGLVLADSVALGAAVPLASSEPRPDCVEVGVTDQVGDQSEGDGVDDTDGLTPAVIVAVRVDERLAEMDPDTVKLTVTLPLTAMLRVPVTEAVPVRAAVVVPVAVGVPVVEMDTMPVLLPVGEPEDVREMDMDADTEGVEDVLRVLVADAVSVAPEERVPDALPVMVGGGVPVATGESVGGAE